jgi:hypothetical protein
MPSPPEELLDQEEVLHRLRRLGQLVQNFSSFKNAEGGGFLHLSIPPRDK